MDSAEELEAISAAEPWRVRVTDRGDAALLGRWREHLGYLAVQGLWCREDRVPALVADFGHVAREHGFERLLGPLVPEEFAGPYLEAGLSVVERVLALRLDAPPGPSALVAPPDGVAVRVGCAADLDDVLALDASSFDAFWRYDGAALTRYAQRERLGVAVREGAVIGYTLATVRGAEGTLGRLAVAGDERGRGVGRALVADAVTAMVSEGARSVTLSTQEHNRASRRLYATLGFRELAGALVATMSGPLDPTPRQGVRWFRVEGS